MTPATAAIVALVGGRGSRLGVRTEHVPKPLLPVRGRPFLDWVLSALATTGVGRVILAAGHAADRARDYAERRRMEIVVEPRPLGTAGALRLVRDRFGDVDPLIVANGDSIVVADLGPAWTTLQDADCVIVGVHARSSEPRFGRLRLSEGLVRGIDDSGPGDIINAGIYFLPRALVDRIPSGVQLSLERDVLPSWISTNIRVRAHVVDAPFIDIGVPTSFESADDFVHRHLASTD